jgi:hypothetical protein
LDQKGYSASLISNYIELMPHKYRYLFCVKNVEKTELSPHFNHDFYPKNTDIFFVCYSQLQQQVMGFIQLRTGDVSIS